MGCDIHLFVEAPAPSYADSPWVLVTSLPCSWCDGTGRHDYGDKDTCYQCDGRRVSARQYRVRNYDLFAMLVGVRNGTWGNDFAPFSEPRGLPSDLSLDLESMKDDLGDHSFSWLTLDEALSIDYERTNVHRGVVHAKEFAAWVNAGKDKAPESYCARSSSPLISNTEMAQAILAGVKTDLSTEVTWTETYRESAGDEWFRFLARCKEADPRCRLVFGFDS